MKKTILFGILFVLCIPFVLGQDGKYDAYYKMDTTPVVTDEVGTSHGTPVGAGLTTGKYNQGR